MKNISQKEKSRPLGPGLQKKNSPIFSFIYFFFLSLFSSLVFTLSFFAPCSSWSSYFFYIFLKSD
jgi:hypothetical protein